MLVHVRFLGSQCFSAPQKSICFSPAPPPLETDSEDELEPWPDVEEGWELEPETPLEAHTAASAVDTTVPGARRPNRRRRGRHRKKNRPRPSGGEDESDDCFSPVRGADRARTVRAGARRE